MEISIFAISEQHLVQHVQLSLVKVLHTLVGCNKNLKEVTTYKSDERVRVK